MKKLEKEFKKFCKSYQHPELGCMIDEDKDNTCEICKSIWTASRRNALEWVLSLAVPNTFITKSMSDIRLIDTKIIEQELEKLK
jgi:hypothetical protein